jgi:PAS domain-containing protein
MVHLTSVRCYTNSMVVPRARFVKGKLRPPSSRYVPVVGILGTLEDITDRKRAEEALRKSEKKREAVLRSIPIGLYRA